MSGASSDHPAHTGTPPNLGGEIDTSGAAIVCKTKYGSVEVQKYPFRIVIKDAKGKVRKMRTVIQRVQKACVSVSGSTVSCIGHGLLLLLGIEDADTEEDIQWLCRKVLGLRIFDDDEGVMNRSVMDVDGEIMVVSQFTLMASTKKGNRPSYIHAAPHTIAVPCYERFCEKMRTAIGKDVATGEFGADMKVRLLNDGPVTILMDSLLRDRF